MSSQGHDDPLARRNHQNEIEKPGGQTESNEQKSVLESLKHLEKKELAQYCNSISVDGVVAQSATIEFDRGQQMWAAKGSLLAYDERISWELSVPGGAGKAVSRALSGESVSMTRVTADAPGATLTIGANQPGRLVTWDLSNGPITCTSGAFVAALGDVDIDVTIAKKTGAMFFGGGGLFMQKLSGDGIVIIHGSGDFIEKHLKPGQNLLVSTGNLACFSNQVSYDIKMTGGCLQSLFGGEGFFMTKMTGPGWVMLQSLKKISGTTDGGSDSS